MGGGLLRGDLGILTLDDALSTLLGLVLGLRVVGRLPCFLKCSSYACHKRKRRRGQLRGMVKGAEMRWRTLAAMYDAAPATIS